ncbi:TetR/AcrR family transcriptional regulator [Leptospira wolffii]|uniref:TetR/AcrR family transcriptional regulator n=1 Tax=Leptospira wolffii TaxID=409998 RepID=A0A2M9ZDH3_9LEPT|nr:TetR family transcriptional regulator [Leptospira wolffii]EPG68047.1 transcriptional regulator, TetR family [Leptospira wolffii serovar Khorat str. Khorat-H2]PJZ66459.1 TetR/AcrR family transcriptional regulator [Leptospira wolffii]TGK59974.1 TetR/AcrR family transcriptional regulator [Leptospira wolffii]TGK70036.1 TetR/AcrR family transcriptional regulator [Leptospira wolffii]TGK75982.1 TetR/AcrR family transcriptional regulator [Leptospira wolffii]
MTLAISETQENILRLAADYASEYGLNDLSIGKLAASAKMSKAGLHGSFGSKMDLQLNTIRYAAEIFRQRVIGPAMELDTGPRRTLAFCRGWLEYIDRKVFPGGCFFTRVSMEGGSLADSVNKEIRKQFQSFRRFLSTELSKGIGHTKANRQSYILADQLLALVISYNWALHSIRNQDAARHIRDLLFDRFDLISKSN